jgi:GNAT superfamily N-acetyltransferase
MPRAAQAPYQIRFIVVDPRAQGMGVGTMLLEEFEGTLPAGSAYHAWTLEGPHGAEGFYLANGFRRDVALNGHLRMWKRP